MPKYGKNRGNTAITFDAIDFQDFDNVAAVAAATANTVVQARLPMPQRFKIFKVGVVYSAIGSGTHSFNIIVGPGVSIGANTVKDASTVLGNSVFQTDQVLTAAADIGQTFIPTNFDTIYDVQGAAGPSSFCPLTLRVTTPAATGSLTNFKVVLLLCSVDALPNHQSATPGVDF